MKYIQCFGKIGANVVDVSPEYVATHSTAFHTFVPWDTALHARFVPRDVIDPATRQIDSTHRELCEEADRLAMVASELDRRFQVLREGVAIGVLSEAAVQETRIEEQCDRASSELQRALAQIDEWKRLNLHSEDAEP